MGPAYAHNATAMRAHMGEVSANTCADPQPLFTDAAEVNKCLCSAAERVHQIEQLLFGPVLVAGESPGRPCNGPPSLADVTGESVRLVRALLGRLEEIHQRIGAPQ